MRPLSRSSSLEREHQRDAAAERMADKGQVAQVAVDDQLRQQLGLVEHRIARVERLVGLAEAFEVDGDDPVVAGELGRDAPPCIGAGAEAVNEEHRRPAALLLVEQLHRRIGRSEPGEPRPVAGAVGPGRASDKRKQRQRG